MLNVFEERKKEILLKSVICKKLQLNIKEAVIKSDGKSVGRYYPIPILEFVKKSENDGLLSEKITGAFGGDCILVNCMNTRPRKIKNNYEALMVLINEEIASLLEVFVKKQTIIVKIMKICEFNLRIM